VILIKQIRGVNTWVNLIKQIREEHRAVSDKINQRSYWNTEVILIVFTPLICFIRITPVFSTYLFYQNHPCIHSSYLFYQNHTCIHSSDW
jgi:hypothetical protein